MHFVGCSDFENEILAGALVRSDLYRTYSTFPYPHDRRFVFRHVCFHVVMVATAGEASPEQEERGLQLQRPRLELQVVRVEIETAIGPLDKFHGHWKVG